MPARTNRKKPTKSTAKPKPAVIRKPAKKAVSRPKAVKKAPATRATKKVAPKLTPKKPALAKKKAPIAVAAKRVSKPAPVPRKPKPRIAKVARVKTVKTATPPAPIAEVKPRYVWDEETDVIVVGFGGAGASAAIAAHDAGAKVLVLEKAPARLPGGNSGCCMGFVVSPTNAEDGFNYYKALSSGTVKDEELIRTFVAELMAVPSWATDLGIPLQVFAQERPGSFPTLPGSTVNQYRVPGGGVVAFARLLKQVSDREIKVMYETPAQRVIQNPLSGEVIGVIADVSGQSIRIKANKGVILSCGGYENNNEMTLNYNYPGLKFYPYGSPYNTGDGIKMASAVGAKLWHMYNLQLMSYTVKAAAEELGCAMPFGVADYGGNFIFVNKSGKRFTNETRRIGHYKGPLEAGFFDHDKAQFANTPFYVIFDEIFRQRGPVVPRQIFPDTKVGWGVVHDVFGEWSEDNQTEIDKGWIVPGYTLDDLAQKLGIRSAALASSVEKYNEYVSASEDQQFGRSPTTMQPISTPPFYAMELALSVINTQGGPVHNAKTEVLNTDEQPIARLYAAGELGSFFGHLYQGGNNFPEALAFGRIAGRNAAALDPWKD